MARKKTYNGESVTAGGRAVGEHVRPAVAAVPRLRPTLIDARPS